jgi:hypothetical protein
MWYAIEAGRAHLRTGSIPRALKYFAAVEGYFRDFNEDQHDFHRYCLKKGTIRAYTDFIAYLDIVRGNHFFVDALVGAISCLLVMHDQPGQFIEKTEDGEDLSKMTAAERKRAKQKADKAKKKEAARLALEAEQAKLEEVQNSEGVENSEKEGEKETPKEVVEEDSDPAGTTAFKEKLAAKPIEEAARLCGLLMEVHSDKPAEITLAAALAMFDVQVRRGKWLLATNALTLAQTIASKDHPEVLRRRVPFAAYVASGKVLCGAWTAAPETFAGSVDVDVDAVVKELVLKRCGGASTSAACVAEAEKVLAGAKDNYALRCAAAEAIVMVSPSEASRVAAFGSVLAIDDKLKLSTIVDGGLALTRMGAGDDVLAKLKAKALTLCPDAESTFALRWL